VLRAVFDLLGIEEMQAAQGALRHGVLYDLLDREQGRPTSAPPPCSAWPPNSTWTPRRPSAWARWPPACCAACAAGDAPAELERAQRKLQWAAQLHEIGSLISHSDYHKHGAYILDNADAPGFALPELHRLSLLVLGHRGKLRKLEADFERRAFVHQLLACAWP
jgi:exopolyphosphatase/guanosine-5'-triphosphate,3'-diphosphate pyrophosphatase